MRRGPLEWTRRQLGADARAFLAALPLKAREGDCLFVHADASAPSDWNYVLDAGDAGQHLGACEARVSFCGHVHKPALYCTAPGGKVTHFCPVAATPVPLLPQRPLSPLFRGERVGVRGASTISTPSTTRRT